MSYMKMVDGETVPMTAEEVADLEALWNTPPSIAVVSSISRRQFAQILALQAVISEVEAIGWAARGDLPGAMETAIEAMPEEAQFSARMLLSSATSFERSHPLTAQLGVLLSYTDAQLDALWTAAGAL